MYEPSEEFGYLTPSDSVFTGNSIMPQKKNPNPIELVCENLLELWEILTLSLSYYIKAFLRPTLVTFRLRLWLFQVLKREEQFKEQRTEPGTNEVSFCPTEMHWQEHHRIWSGSSKLALTMVMTPGFWLLNAAIATALLSSAGLSWKWISPCACMWTWALLM